MPYFNGWVNAIRAPIKFCSVLVGNIPGVIDNANVNDIPSTVQAVVTRSSAKASSKSRYIRPLALSKLDPIKIDNV